MKKTFIALIFLTSSTLLNATKEVKAKIYYDIDNKRVLVILIDSKNQIDKEKCEQYIVSEDGKKILEIISKNQKGRVYLSFICNQEITERR